MNVLISSISRKVSLLRSFQKALEAEGGGKVIGVDVSPLAPALYFADEHYLVPPSHLPNFVETMLDLCRKLDIKLVVPTRDEELAIFAENLDKFSNIGTFVMVPDLTTLQICQDKELFYEFCQENKFATSKTYKHQDLSGNLVFPLFVKPRHGKGSKLTAVAHSREELLVLLEQIPNPLVQEYVKAKEYTIDLFADLSGKIISAVPRERIYVFGGESFISKTYKNSLLIKEAMRLATVLRLIGHNTLQCFFDGEEVKFIEVNPRYGGAAPLGFAAGAPTPHFLIKLLKGEEVKPRIGDFQDNYIMLRYTDDLFFSAESLNTGARYESHSV